MITMMMMLLMTMMMLLIFIIVIKSVKDTYVFWLGFLCEEADDDGGCCSEQGDEQGEVHVVEVLQDGRPAVRLAAPAGVVVHERQDHPGHAGNER